MTLKTSAAGQVGFEYFLERLRGERMIARRESSSKVLRILFRKKEVRFSILLKEYFAGNKYTSDDIKSLAKILLEMEQKNLIIIEKKDDDLVISITEQGETSLVSDLADY